MPEDLYKEDLYKIGAVAKRTGITPECLRAWERRYGLEPADRAGNTRFYSATQLDRLTTIKSLLDQGHPISQVIHLSEAELQRRLRPSRPEIASNGGGRLGLVGSPLVQAYREAADPGVEVVAEWASVSDMHAERGALPELDCVVVYVPSLDPKRVEIVEQMRPEAQIVVAFKYATSADLEYFRGAGYALLRWPAEWATVEKIAAARLQVPGNPATRLYSEEELLHIGSMASRAACDCPRHLAELIGDLGDYSAHARRCDGHEDHDAISRDLNAALAQLEHSLRALVEKHGLLEMPN